MPILEKIHEVIQCMELSYLSNYYDKKNIIRQRLYLQISSNKNIEKKNFVVLIFLTRSYKI